MGKKFDTEKFFLTEEEKLQIGNELSAAFILKTELEDGLKEVKASYKAKIEEQELIFKTTARLIRDGYEIRKVRWRNVRITKTESWKLFLLKPGGF